MKSYKQSKKKTYVKATVLIAVSAITLFLLVFLLYDSPANYITKPDGSIYINNDGQPLLYYTDLFGNTFYAENGRRVYSAVPVYIDDTPAIAPPSTEE